MDLPRSNFKKGSKIWYLDDENNTGGYTSEWNSNRIITLRDFSDRTIAMGTVAAIHPHGLEIHLLNNMIGFADYRNVYSKNFLIKNGIKDSLTFWHKHKLQFPVGSDVIVKRLPEGDSASGYIPLTLDPEEVNGDLTDEIISENMLIPAIVKSRESHGILLEIPLDDGKSSWKGFISFPKHKMKIYSGNLIYVVIDQVNFDGKILKCNWPSARQQKYTLSHSNIASIRPGSIVSTVVDFKKYNYEISDPKVPFPTCIKATILAKFNAILPCTHLCKYSLKSEKFVLAKYAKNDDTDVVASDVLARIILVNYDRKEIYISILPSILMWKFGASETYTLKKSKKFKNCTLLRTFNNYGLQFLITGYSSKSRWQNSIGFLHNTMGAGTGNISLNKRGFREVYYNYFERWSVLSSKSTESTYRYMSPQHLYSGIIIRCRIEKILSNGVFLRTVHKTCTSKTIDESDIKYTSPFSVWIHLSHLTNIPLNIIPKRFKVGKVVRARVLEFDFTRKLVLATAKKSLINDDCALINIYNVKSGQKVTGFISLGPEKLLNKVAKNVTVKFFSGIRAQLSQTDQMKMLQQGISIKNGTVVTGNVIKVYQGENKVDIKCI